MVFCCKVSILFLEARTPRLHNQKCADGTSTLTEVKEAAPHLILYAFLQRVLNGGGEIMRESAAGTGRADLCVVYEGEKYPIELQIRRGDKTIAEALVQTMQYMDTFGCQEGWVVIFDQRSKTSWEDKIFLKKEMIEGKTVTVIGM